MKHILTLSLFLMAVVVSSSWNQLGASEPSPGYVDFGTLSPAEADGEFVEVQIRKHLISMAARLTEKSEPEVAAILRNLEYVRVNVVGLGDKNRSQVEDRVRVVSKQLDAEGWERVVMVRDGKEKVDVHMKTRGDEAVLGVVVTVLDGGKEAVFVNIVGDIKPEELAVVGERFNLEPLKKLKKLK